MDQNHANTKMGGEGGGVMIAGRFGVWGKRLVWTGQDFIKWHEDFTGLYSIRGSEEKLRPTSKTPQEWVSDCVSEWASEWVIVWVSEW